MFGRSGLAAGNRARALVLPPGKGGLPAEAPAITLDEVSDAWRRYYKPANALVILAGAVGARAPARGDERYAPFLVLAARLAEAGPGRFAPLDDPEVLTVCAPARPGD